jgi:hypothetical protein
VKRILLVLFIAALCSVSSHPPTASSARAPAGKHHPPRACAHHSRFTPNWRCARYWTTRYFGRTSQRDLMMCVAYRESRYELSPPPNQYYGPWQVSKYWHPWIDTWRITHSWRYAAAVSWHLSGYGTNFHAWASDCGIA